VQLTREKTQALLKEVPQTYNTQINDALLTAVAQAFADGAGIAPLLINLEGHGREELFPDVDLSRTVGWFTTIFPVYLYLPERTNPGDALKAIKEQLRRVPNRGIGYGLLRYLHDEDSVTRPLRELPQAEITFNYLGQFDQVLPDGSLFTLAAESKGPDRYLQGERPYLLEINGFIVEHRLQVNWVYSQNVHQSNTIEKLARRFIEALRALVAHCQSTDGVEYTPSDFPMASLDDQKLADLLEKVEFEE
jgi:non-ribosomal peptide synthase protein (TIGR01720 family)